MIDNQDIAGTLKAAAAEVLGISEQSLEPEARLREDLGLDSIDIFDILALLSRTFHQDLHAEEFRDVRTVADFVARLESILSRK